MDPITIAKALSVAILPLCKYSKAVYEAGGELQELRHELVELGSVLEDVKEALDHSDDDSDILGQKIVENNVNLNKLCEKLKAINHDIRERKGFRRNILAPLTWPFQKESILETIGSVQRTKTTLLVALSAWKIQHDKEEAERKRMLKWLCRPDIRFKYYDILRPVKCADGDWIWRQTVVQSWTNTDRARKMLCLYGAAGSGKTVLAARIITGLLKLPKKRPQSKFAVVGVSHNHRGGSVDLSTVMGSLMRQLLQARGRTVPTDEKAAYYRDRLRNHSRPHPKKLYDWFERVAKSLTAVFVVIDGIDAWESDSQHLLRNLRKMSSRVRLLITCRELTVLQAILGDTKEIAAQGDIVRLNTYTRDEDIHVYVENRLKYARCLSHIDDDKSEILRPSTVDSTGLRQRIADVVCHKANGIFPVVKCFVDYLCGQTCVQDIEDRLHDKYWDELDHLHGPAMKQLDKEKHGRQLGTQVLRWLMHPCGSMSVQELQHALAFVPGKSKIRSEEITPAPVLVWACAGLVTIDEMSTTATARIRLTHPTIATFLSRQKKYQFIRNDAAVANVCLQYLLFDQKFTHNYNNRRELAVLHGSLPLLYYAAEFCESPERLGSTLAIRDKVEELLRLPAAVSNWYQLLTINRTVRWLSGTSASATPLHLLAAMGKGTVAGWYLQDREVLDNVNVGDMAGRTALHLAAMTNNCFLARYLLSAKADSRITDPDGLKPIDLAVIHKSTDVERILREHSADPHAVGSRRHENSMWRRRNESTMTIVAFRPEDDGIDDSQSMTHSKISRDIGSPQTPREIAQLLEAEERQSLSAGRKVRYMDRIHHWVQTGGYVL